MKIASPDAKHVVYVHWSQCENDIHPHVSTTLFTNPLGEGFPVFTADVEKESFNVEWHDATTLVVHYSEDSATTILRREDAWKEVRVVFEVAAG
jgi:hypothetical protein